MHPNPKFFFTLSNLLFMFSSPLSFFFSFYCNPFLFPGQSFGQSFCHAIQNRSIQKIRRLESEIPSGGVFSETGGILYLCMF